MKDKVIIDIGRIMDEIFEATQNFSDTFKEGFCYNPGFENHFKWDERTDFYPAYSYPPANIFITEDKTLNFEFALAGFSEKDIQLSFQTGRSGVVGCRSRNLQEHLAIIRW